MRVARLGEILSYARGMVVVDARDHGDWACGMSCTRKAPSVLIAATTTMMMSA